MPIGVFKKSEPSDLTFSRWRELGKPDLEFLRLAQVRYIGLALIAVITPSQRRFADSDFPDRLPAKSNRRKTPWI